MQTGFPLLDCHFDGFKPGSLTLISSFCGGGKTTALVNLSNQNYLDGKRVLAVTFETPIEQWNRRLIAINLKIPYDDLIDGFSKYSYEERLQKYKEIEEFSKRSSFDYKAFFATAHSLTWREITEEIEKCFEGFNPDIIYIDQLSLINTSCYQTKYKKEELLLLVKEIKEYALKKRTRIVVAVQANRSAIEKEDNGDRTINIGLENCVEDLNPICMYADNVFSFRLNGDQCFFDIIKTYSCFDMSVELGFDKETRSIVDPSNELF